MTNLTELEKKYEELGKEIEALKNTEPDNGIWIPAMGEGYYTILSDRGSALYSWTNDCIDKRCLKLGHIFLTAEECDYYIKMEDRAFEIRKSGRWGLKVGKDNWSVCTYEDDKAVMVYNTRCTNERCVYFDTKEQCEVAFEGLSYADVSYMISKRLI